MKLIKQKAIGLFFLSLFLLSSANAQSNGQDVIAVLEGVLNGSVGAASQSDEVKNASEAEKLVGIATVAFMFGNIDVAMVKFDELTTKYPTYGPGQYNYSCALAKTGKSEKSLKHLALAIKTNPVKYKRMAANDKDFASIQHTAEFQSLIGM